MKPLLLLLSVLFSTFAFSQIGVENFQSYSKQEVAQIENDFTLDKLRLYPIKAKQNYHDAYKDVEDFISLEIALKKSYIVISEVSNSGNVNTLKVKNNSNFTIYGLAGEVITGGKQDRILGDDVIIKPNEEKYVTAFCVERNRWSQAATGNDFKGYYNVSSNTVRKAAVVDKNQSKVWKNVEEVVVKQNAKTSTGTYAALKNNEAFNDKKEAYLKHFKNKWAKNKDVIGVIAVSGNKVIGCDIFATHQLFNNSYNNLLHAYISEALTNGSKVTINYDTVKKYLNDILNAQNPDEAKLKAKGNLFKSKGKTLHLSSF